MIGALADIAKQLQRIADALELIAKNQKSADFDEAYKNMQRREPRQHY